MMLKIKIVQRIVAGLTFLLGLLSKVVLRLQKQNQKPQKKKKKLLEMMNIKSELDSSSLSEMVVVDDDDRYGLSWRLAVETNNINVRPWKTVPLRCYKHVENYMTGGQYEHDMKVIVDEIVFYASQITTTHHQLDAWILDVDDTCISNIPYYKVKRYGCDPFDSTMFKAWINQGKCPANTVVLRLFETLIEKGFKVFLLTGRYEETLAKITMDNLHNQGFIGYQRLILRSLKYKGQSAVEYKSSIRKEIEEEGYRIWGNVGDQWTDLQGDCLGDRTFKLPNPMYCIS